MNLTEPLRQWNVSNTTPQTFGLTDKDAMHTEHLLISHLLTINCQYVRGHDGLSNRCVLQLQKQRF